jgi:hypothetical protein
MLSWSLDLLTMALSRQLFRETVPFKTKLQYEVINLANFLVRMTLYV